MAGITVSKRLSRIIAEDAHLANLLRTSETLLRATRMLRDALDPVFADHCAVARLSPDHVVVAVDGAVWASRMRYLIPQLEAHFAQHLEVTRAPRVEIKVLNPPTVEQPKVERELTDNSRASIRQTASALPPGRLRDALERLADD